MNDWLDGYEVDEVLAAPAGAASYPVLQWNHGEGAMLAEVEKWEGYGLTLPWPVKQVRFGAGRGAAVVDCYHSSAVDVAILGTKVRWFDRATGALLPGYQDGAYSRLHVLSLVKGAAPQEQPALLSLKGVAAGDLSKLLTRARRVIQQAEGQAGRRLSLASFWWRVTCGEARAVGSTQQAIITPPELDLPARGLDVLAWLGERYIGPALLATVNGLAQEVIAWQEAGKAPAAQGAGSGSDEEAVFWTAARLLKLADYPATVEQADMARKSGDWPGAMAWLYLQEESGEAQVLPY